MSNNAGDAAVQLVLGTAQLGMTYGVANSSGPPDMDTAIRIVGAAVERGVSWFDTAQDYGDSEAVLGRAFKAVGIPGDAQVVSKLSSSVDMVRSALSASVNRTLAHLEIPRLLALLLHEEAALDQWPNGLGEGMIEMKHDGRISKIGVSVYSVERALQALDIEHIDIVQVPGNVFDRRMVRAGVFARAAERGKTVFVRSVFLQGLALLPPDEVPSRVRGGRDAIGAFNAFCVEHGIDRRHAAIDYVRSMAPGSPMVIGAEAVDQIVDNCRIIRLDALPKDIREGWNAAWPHDDPELLDPRRWQ